MKDPEIYPKDLKQLFSSICVSSEILDASDTTETSLEDVQVDLDRYMGLENILNRYDAVVEVYDGSAFLEPTEEELDRSSTDYHALTGDALVLGWNYDSKTGGLETVQEKLSGDAVVLAFGFDGQDLPNYQEMNGELDSRGNWWDHPEFLDADMVVDDETYSGALRPPKKADVSSHVLRGGKGMRDVFHLKNI